MEAGYVGPPVGDGAIKAEVGRTAMEILSQHVAVIKNKCEHPHACTLRPSIPATLLTAPASPIALPTEPRT